MKYLAILKDSLREAIDAKIFFVTVAISVLTSFLILSVSFAPVPMNEMVDQYTELMNLLTNMKHPQAPKFELQGIKNIEIHDFKRLDSGTEPWTGNYQFIMDLELWDEAVEVNKPVPADKQGGPVPPGKKITTTTMRIPITGFYQWFRDVDIKALPSDDPKHLRFGIKTTGIQVGFRSRQEWFHQPALLFGLVPLPIKVFKLEQIVRFIGNDVVGNFGAAVTMLLSCIITAFFIPNMMARGTIDLLVVKPINRMTLFVYKFLGGMTFMLLNTTVIMLGVWLGVGLQTGFWVHNFLLCIPIFTFQFLIFYSISALSGVMTRSPIVSILSVVALWAALTSVGYAYWLGVESFKVQDRPSGELELEKQTVLPAPQHWGITLIEVLHAVMPRYKDLDWLTAKSIKAELIKPEDMSKPGMEDYRKYQLRVLERQYGTYEWLPALGVSTLFICVIAGLAGWRFSSRDY
jgi:hypothetical protein